MISPWAELRQKALGIACNRGLGPAVRWVDRAVSSEKYVDWVSGAVLLVCRADAEAAGLLDERYFLYTEDVDFCAAIRARGRRVLFTPEATVTHLRGRSRATVPGAMNAAYRRSHLAFYEKHHPYWAPLLRIYLRLKGQAPIDGRQVNSELQRPTPENSSRTSPWELEVGSWELVRCLSAHSHRCPEAS